MIIEINKESAKILSRALLMARIDWERSLEHIKNKDVYDKARRQITIAYEIEKDIAFKLANEE